MEYLTEMRKPPFIAYRVSLRIHGEDHEEVISEEEIVDKVMGSPASA